LTELLRKDVKFKWESAQQIAFEEIKLRLGSKPVLAVYNPNARTEVHTDACAIGLGGVLLQEQSDGKLHPVSYFSRKTTKDESKYHSFELEALAIVCALERFRVYLLGIKFVIRTDCNSLKLLANKRDLSARIGRWFVRLSEFNYTIEYHKGVRNVVADGLSRNPVGEAEEEEIQSLLRKNQEKMKTQFDKKRRKPPTYSEKDLVMVRCEAPSTGQSRKLTAKYRGPYEVVKALDNDRYLVQDIEGEQQSARIYKGILPVDRLKLVPKSE
jgi:hypothetical protein